MRILSLDADRIVTAHGSAGFTVATFGRAVDAPLIMLALEPGGVIGRHPAVGRQLLVVLTGTARVSGDSGPPVDIGPGAAALWEAGESHETRSANGMTALVVEGELDVDPAPPAS